VHLCAGARSVLNFHKTFLKCLHDEKPSKQHDNRAIAIQHGDRREFMSSQTNTVCGVTLNVAECLDKTDYT
jgi:hypothetical protein